MKFNDATFATNGSAFPIPEVWVNLGWGPVLPGGARWRRAAQASRPLPASTNQLSGAPALPWGSSTIAPPPSASGARGRSRSWTAATAAGRCGSAMSATLASWPPPPGGAFGDRFKHGFLCFLAVCTICWFCVFFAFLWYFPLRIPQYFSGRIRSASEQLAV